MKSLLFFACILLSAVANAQEPKTFAINGSMNNITMPVDKIFLSYYDGEKGITDSIEAKNGIYAFSGKIKEPLLARLRVRYKPGADGKPVRSVAARDNISVFISPAVMNVASTDSFANAKVQGSEANDAFIVMTAMLKPANDVYSGFVAEYNKANAAKDAEAKTAAGKKLDSMDIIIRGVYGNYYKKYPQSPIAFFALAQHAGWDIDPELIEPMLNKLPAGQKKYSAMVRLTSSVDIAKKTSIGKLAMDFTQNDTLGVPVKLSAFRGKYVLVDFWASWCGPCRVENPNVVKAYQAYKNKNFHIIGVSLDRPDAKDKWMEAIHSDNLTWTHVSDLKFWENDVAKQYGIQAIPQNLLIDPNGKIIAKNLDGEKLGKKLAELLP